MDFKDFVSDVVQVCFNQEKIVSCPFCHSKKVGIDLCSYYYDLPYVVRCKRCHANGPNKATEEEAVEAWNTCYRKD